MNSDFAVWDVVLTRKVEGTVVQCQRREVGGQLSVIRVAVTT